MARLLAGFLGLLLVGPTTSAQISNALQLPGRAPVAPPRDNISKTGTAHIRGHVFAAETGRPLSRAQVRAVSSDARENRLTTTDVQGAYEFKDVPAGRYSFTASKGGYVGLEYGQKRPFEHGTPLEILDQRTVEKIDFSLPRGSVITGRIVDEFGEPAAEVQVMPMRYQYLQGRRRLTPTGRSATTNDIGEFRVFGLPPGQYYVTATLRRYDVDVVDSDDRSGYAPTYFPGTPNVAEAQRVTVGLGQTRSDVNMALTATRTAKVSGTAIDSHGRQLSGGMVLAMERNGKFFFDVSSSGSIGPDGRFTISGLAPGDYTLRANVPGDALMPELATADITVNGDDVTGVLLVAAQMVTATGRIVVSDPTAAETLRPTSIRVAIAPPNPDDMFVMLGSGGGAVKDDFTFELRSLPVRMNLRLASQPPGWALKAIRLNGADLTDTGIDFASGGDFNGIEVELTNRLQEVSGVVTNARGDAVKDYSVVVFPQDREMWTGPSRHMAVGRPDQDGRFKTLSLPPGSYYAIALDYVEPGEWGDPEFLERVRPDATTFSVGEGQTMMLDLKIKSASK